MRGPWSASPKPSTCSHNRCQTHKDVSRRETHFFLDFYLDTVSSVAKNIQMSCDDFTCERSVSVHQYLSCLGFFLDSAVREPGGGLPAAVWLPVSSRLLQTGLSPGAWRLRWTFDLHLLSPGQCLQNVDLVVMYKDKIWQQIWKL